MPQRTNPQPWSDYDPDPVRWFEELGPCHGNCGRPGIGVLRGPRNDSYGPYCRKCAEKRLRRAAKLRMKGPPKLPPVLSVPKAVPDDEE